jgi:hypothetical protein
LEYAFSKSGGNSLIVILPLVDKRGNPMTYSSGNESTFSGANASRQFIASYDLGYEFSQEHYINLQCMVEDAAEEATLAQVLEEVA